MKQKFKSCLIQKLYLVPEDSTQFQLAILQINYTGHKDHWLRCTERQKTDQSNPSPLLEKAALLTFWVNEVNTTHLFQQEMAICRQGTVSEMTIH